MYSLEVDFGEGKTRPVVAGVAKHCKIEELKV